MEENIKTVIGRYALLKLNAVTITANVDLCNCT